MKKAPLKISPLGRKFEACDHDITEFRDPWIIKEQDFNFVVDDHDTTATLRFDRDPLYDHKKSYGCGPILLQSNGIMYTTPNVNIFIDHWGFSISLYNKETWLDFYSFMGSLWDFLLSFKCPEINSLMKRLFRACSTGGVRGWRMKLETKPGYHLYYADTDGQISEGDD